MFIHYRQHRYIKRGIAATPTKFAINFGYKPLNQAGCLLHVYVDGTVLLTHAGMEMGQGLHTKMAQIVSHELQLPLDMVRMSCAIKVKLMHADKH